MTGLDLLVLAPHFDDAVYSCGGLLARLSAGGRRAAVLTVCGGRPSGVLSPFAAALHRRWGQPAGAPGAAAMVDHRRDEDRAALALLGVVGEALDIPDCIYRRAPDGHWPYASEAALFGAVQAADEAVAEDVVAALAARRDIGQRTRVLAPLAVGAHVDHQLTRRAAEAWSVGRPLALRYYEDYPYAEDGAALDRALAEAGPWRARRVWLAPAHLAAKVAAMAAYGSQVTSFWSDTDQMAERVRAFARRRGGEHPAECLWERAP